MGDPFRSGPPSGGDPRSVLHVALELLRQVHEARDQYEDAVDRLDDYLRTQSEYLNIKEYTSGHPGPGRPAPPLARCLKIKRNPDGSGIVQIDGEKPFRLPAGLTDFLEHLASDEAASADMLVAWKSRLALREWFQKQSGMPVGSNYVNKRVHDLRSAICVAGIKRHVVHTHHRKGVRFALRRSSRASPRVVGAVWG
jgi:hypothetical protein